MARVDSVGECLLVLMLNQPEFDLWVTGGAKNKTLTVQSCQ
jgi:hypothetical protein